LRTVNGYSTYGQFQAKDVINLTVNVVEFGVAQTGPWSALGVFAWNVTGQSDKFKLAIYNAYTNPIPSTNKEYKSIWIK
jgi:hypothetical protein